MNSVKEADERCRQLLRDVLNEESQEYVKLATEEAVFRKRWLVITISNNHIIDFVKSVGIYGINFIYSK